MKIYSAFAKTISVIISIIVSYFLVIIRFQCIAGILDDLTANVKIWTIMEFGGALLCIITPVIVAWCIFKFKLRCLLWVFPIIFLLVLVYSPPGFYFIILKGGFLYPESKSIDWKYGISISIMFYTLQLFTLSITRGILAFRAESKREKHLKLQQDNLNQVESEKEIKE